MSCSVAASEPLVPEDRAGMAAAEVAELVEVLASQRTLEDVVRWGLSQSPPRMVVDVIVQDEYTHDVVVTLRPPDRFLVYDTT